MEETGHEAWPLQGSARLFMNMGRGALMFANEIIIFFNLLKTCYEAVSVYPSDNPMLSKQLQNFIKTSEKFCDESGGLAMAVRGGGVEINEQGLPPQAERAPSARWFVDHCERRGVRDIRFEAGVDVTDLAAFFGLLRVHPDSFSKEGDAARMLAELGARRIRVNQSQPPREVQSGAAVSRENNQTAMSGGGGPQLFISADDWEALFQSISDQIRNGRLDKAGEALSAMRRDLTSADRAVREMAFSSYHVAALSMLMERQDKPLFAILKSIAEDFQRPIEADLFTIHVGTVVKIVEYFKGSKQMGALVYGLNLLADARMRQEGDSARLLDERLRELADPGLVDHLLELLSSDLGSLSRPLFSQRAEGFLAPLLQALYLSEDRHVRKKLLEILGRLGERVHERILAELWLAIERDAPWYVRRNLLNLLQPNPPAALMDALEAPGMDDHPRLRDAVQRCLFQLHHKKAYAQGIALLREAGPEQLRKLFGYVVAGRRALYAPHIIEIFQKTEEEPIKLEALKTLARLESEPGIQFLAKILGRSTMFGGQSQRRLRAAAARSLAANGGPKAMACLTRFVKDGDKAVREIVNHALDATR